ncbi:MAG: hypothetical protein PSX37_12420 [bacterium]|nr:hypothetical protein [bacterium]
MSHAKTASDRVSIAGCCLVRAGKPISRAAAELGIGQSFLPNWARQDLIDRGERVAVRRVRARNFVRRDGASAQLELEVSAADVLLVSSSC